MLNKKKYIFSLIFIIFTVFLGVSFVSATETMEIEEKQENVINGIIDTKIIEGVYKTSDNETTYLPNIRYVVDRMIVDSELKKSGFSFATKSIEINSPTKGIQAMFSSDSIRVNSNMEYGILIADGNIIVDSQIDKSLVLVSTGTITLTENAKINEDLIFVSDTLELNGEVIENVIGSAVSININGNIGKDLRVVSNDVKFSTDENVKNNIYVETYNKDLRFTENYANAKIVLKEVKEEKIFTFEKIISILGTCLVFTLIYIILNKIAKKNIFMQIKNKVKENSTFVILSGAILILASIPVVCILLMLSITSLYVVAIPLLLVYVVFLIVIGILNIFVVGSIMYSYIKEKYLKTSGIGTDILGVFCSFLVLSVLAILPVVGGYISIILYIIANGIVFTLIFKKKKING